MDELYYAFIEVMEAKANRDKAREEYAGYSWGYHGADYEKNLGEAQARFKAGFKNAVREAMNELSTEAAEQARRDMPGGRDAKR